MNPVALLILVLTVVGCADEYDAPDTPYIVGIDPARQLWSTPRRCATTA